MKTEVEAASLESAAGATEMAGNIGSIVHQIEAVTSNLSRSAQATGEIIVQHPKADRRHRQAGPPPWIKPP